MTPEAWKPEAWIGLVGLVIASGGGIVAIATYLRDVRIKQTDWLYQLFEKFYEKPQYKSMRRILDNDQSPDFARLRSAIAQLEDTQVHEDFVDFLNFFEFICNLAESRRMSRSDMNRLFDYYLGMLSRRDFVISYCREQGFESLARELVRRHVRHGR
jgi:hypothetical protein